MMLVADLKPAEYGDNKASVCADLNQHEVLYITSIDSARIVHQA